MFDRWSRALCALGVALLLVALAFVIPPLFGQPRLIPVALFGVLVLAAFAAVRTIPSDLPSLRVSAGLASLFTVALIFTIAAAFAETAGSPDNVADAALDLVCSNAGAIKVALGVLGTSVGASAVLAIFKPPAPNTAGAMIFSLLRGFALAVNNAKPKVPALAVFVAAVGLGLAACSATQNAAVQQQITTVEAGAQQAASLFCKTDQGLVPIVQTEAGIALSVAGVVDPAIAAGGQALLALDATTLHPAVVSACGAANGTVVAAPAAATAPAAKPTSMLRQRIEHQLALRDALIR